MVRHAVVVPLLLCLAGAAGAQGAAPALTDAQVRELVPLKRSLQTVQDLAAAGLTDGNVTRQATERYLALAGTVAGRPVTAAELTAVPDAPRKLTALQKFAGFVTFVNTLWVFAIIIGVACAAYLFGDLVSVLFEILKDIPLFVYEAVFYGASIGLTAWANSWRPGVAQYVALTGCLLFAGALGFTISRRKLGRRTGLLFFGVLSAFYCGVALSLTSPLIGFFAVIALMGALGFSVIVSPLCYAIGFDDEDALGKATAGAFILLAVFTGLAIAGSTRFMLLDVFGAGALWMGSFVGYLGLLIASSRWYGVTRYPYVLRQAVTVVAGIAALAVGSVWHIPELQRIGGTFFALYCVEKLAEIPVESKRAYAILGLVISGLVWWFCLQVKANPELYRQYLLI